MFEFSTRQAIPANTAEIVRKTVARGCTTPCVGGVQRSEACACYREFAARYTLRLGAFPPASTDYTDFRGQYVDPGMADSVERFIASPDKARDHGWSSLISGPARSGKTALATHLTKSVIGWETVYSYSRSCRAIYFTSRDYGHWLRKMDDFRRTDAEVAYYEGALVSSVVVWDDIDPAFANEPRFAMDVKKRLASGLSTHIVLSQDPELYLGSLLAITLGLSAQNSEVRTTVKSMVPLSLNSEILSVTGWV